MRRRTILVHCQDCKRHLFTYIKFGKGTLIRCWKNRIIENNTVKRESLMYCPCGQLIGVDKNMFILLKKHRVVIKK